MVGSTRGLETPGEVNHDIGAPYRVAQSTDLLLAGEVDRVPGRDVVRRLEALGQPSGQPVTSCSPPWRARSTLVPTLPVAPVTAIRIPSGTRGRPRTFSARTGERGSESNKFAERLTAIEHSVSLICEIPVAGGLDRLRAPDPRPLPRPLRRPHVDLVRGANRGTMLTSTETLEHGLVLVALAERG